MEYAEAFKKVTATKPKENYMLITLSYDNKIVLPHKDGLAFMAALNTAEKLDEPYNGQHRITELERKAFEVVMLSNAEYIRIKIAALLGVKPDEIKPQELAVQ